MDFAARPKWSIVIPTYKHSPAKTIESMRRYTLPEDLARSEFWVVANGSPKETEDLVREVAEESPADQWHLVSCPEALGYTKAVNVGIVASRADLVVLANDDCEILNWGAEWLRILEKPFLEEPAMAATGSTRDLWAKGKYFLVFYMVMLRRDLLVQFGLLDDVFNPGAGEDCDFCLRVQSRGYKIRQVPVEFPRWQTGFPIFHVGGTTVNQVENWGRFAERNTKILEARWPRTDEDRALGKAFSDGLQNSHRWQKEREEAEKAKGVQ